MAYEGTEANNADFRRDCFTIEKIRELSIGSIFLVLIDEKSVTHYFDCLICSCITS